PRCHCCGSEDWSQARAVIGHNVAFYCHHSLAEPAAAGDHALHALLLAQQLHAPRFVAEALAFRAEINRLLGKRSEAQSDVQEGLALARKTGMAFAGPLMLGIAALAIDDANTRRELLAEADAILSAGAAGHNHLLFRKDAIEVCLQMGDWQG